MGKQSFALSPTDRCYLEALLRNQRGTTSQDHRSSREPPVGHSRWNLRLLSDKA
jgi:hypothetical protein